jgi:drug/metabolite transporter (DMT)-like permease
MYEDLIFPLIMVLSLLFIIIVPCLLYAGLKKIANPVPLWLPLLLAVVVLLVMGGILQFHIFTEPNSMAGTLVYFFLFLILTSLAVITPYLWIGEKNTTGRPWLILALLSFIGVIMMFWTTMGESKEGGPLPQFFPLLPLTGGILDVSASLLNSRDIVYSADLPVHTLLLAAGLYLEVFIMATLICVLAGMLAGERTKK